ncbi:hypothetical protein D9619_006177 [Psilocybe cf. subviscida]|uniref:F-box domain-containing protein n=1 Tax=Psilocybe cf. subviscida TaxID=2480587 RepID=A0A8H5EXD3_9AGAR|nr:hypothetical protein D9619_006177 [Psilocybe cf. subviscida]
MCSGLQSLLANRDLGDNNSVSTGSSSPTNPGVNDSPISKLPPELLVRIFEHHVTYSVVVCWYQITHVCRHWRALAIETAWLWTTVPTDPHFDNPEWTRIVLERSRNELLDITLIATPWKMNLAVYRHISHIRTLSLQYLDVKELEDMVFTLSVIGDDAKELEDLQILGCEYDDPQFKLPPTCFRGASKLECLDLEWVEIDWQMPFLSQILSHLSLQNMSPASRPSWAELLGALACMPDLRNLTLKQAFPDIPARSHTERVHLPCLHQLSVAADIAFQVESFFSHVTFPPLERVVIGCKENDPGSDNYSAALQSVARMFPPSSYGRFNQLGIEAGESHGFYFLCRTFPNDPESGGAIDVALSPTVDVSTEWTIANIIDNFNFYHSLTHLAIGARGEATSVPPESLRELFGSMPNLEDISASNNNALNLIRALTIPTSHLFGTPVSFPVLRKIDLRVIDIEHDKEQCDELEDILMARYEYGAEIQTLSLSQCFHISAAVVERFAHIVMDLNWSEDGISSLISAMKRERAHR